MELKTVRRVSGKVLVMGDSISDDGRYISYMNAFMALACPEEKTHFFNAGVSSETLSGLSEPEHPFPRPCGFDRLARALDAVKPDWVLVQFGMNDGIYYPLNEERLAAFKAGYRRMTDAIHAAGCGVIAVTPPPFDTKSFAGPLLPENAEPYAYSHPYEGYDEVLAAESAFILDREASGADLAVDLRTPLLQDREALRAEDPEAVSGDGIHPDAHGHWVMAAALLKALFNRNAENFLPRLSATEAGVEWLDRFAALDRAEHTQLKECIGHELPVKAPLMSPEAAEAARVDAMAELDIFAALHPALLEGEDEFRGYRMLRFFFRGFDALMVFPKEAAADGRWAIRTEFFGAFADADETLLRRGYHLAYIRQCDRYGTPETADLLEAFRKYAALRFGLSQRIGLLGLSRGGLYAAHYAGTYPENTAALYLDAPVVDLASWPMGMDGDTPSACTLECLREFEMTKEDMSPFYTFRARMHESLVAHRVPMILVAGDSDDAVPFEKNGRMLEGLYREAGIPFALELKPGVGHHPHGPTDPEAVADFWDRYGRW